MTDTPTHYQLFKECWAYFDAEVTSMFIIRLSRSVVGIGFLSWLFCKYGSVVKNMVRTLFVMWLMWDIATIVSACFAFSLGTVYDGTLSLLITFPDRIISTVQMVVLFRFIALVIYMKAQNDTEYRLTSDLNCL